MSRLTDPHRLAVVALSGLLDAPADPRFDRVARLAVRLTGARAALVSLVTAEAEVVVGAHGVTPLAGERRRGPLAHAPCRVVVESGAPLVVTDLRQRPELAVHPALRALGAVAWAGVPLLTDDGHVAGTLCVADVAPREWTDETPEALAELAATAGAALPGRSPHADTATRARELVDGLDAIVWEADPHTSLFTYVNRPAEAILGYPLERWYTDPGLWPGMIHPDDRERVLRTAERATAARQGHTLEYRVRTADGRVRWLRDVVALVLDAAGEPWRLRGVMVDVTEQRDAEAQRDRLATLVERTSAALRASEARLREAQQLARMGSWEYDTATGLLTWSDEMRRLHAVEADVAPLALDDWLARVHPEDRDRVRRALQDDGRRGEIWETELRVVLPDGAVRWHHVRATPVRGAGVLARWVGVTQDVTERRELEQQLRHAQKMEAIGQLAGGVTHDFNNLLAAILANCELLLADLPPQSPSRVDAEEIREAAQRAAALTRQLLAFGRKQVLQPRLLDLSDVVRGLERMLRRLIVDDVTLRFELAPSLSPVHADPGQLEQVLVNLALNARDAMPDGGRLTVRTAEVTLAGAAAAETGLPPGRYVALVVADEGTGMDEATRVRACEPFFSTKPAGRGTGLGLATVHGIARQSGGDVRIWSAPGRGTTVTVLLPVASADAEARDDDRPTAPTVLLVDDEDAVRASLERMITRFGYRVLSASGGEAALRVAAEHRGRINVLLTDVVMPGLSGPALAERLTALHPESRVIFMSGYARGARADFQLAADAPLLEKPFAGVTLAQRIRDVLDGA